MIAALSPDIELVGATVVNGNTTLEYRPRTRSGCSTGSDAGGPGLPRHVDRPIARPQREARMADPDPRRQAGPAGGVEGSRLQPQHAVDWLIDTYLASERRHHARPRGAAHEHRDGDAEGAADHRRIPEIVIMGGAHDHGNSTASAEFNIWLDPEAARIVVNCGRPIRMVPLDATHRALVSTGGRRAAAGPGHAGGRGRGAVRRSSGSRATTPPSRCTAPGRRPSTTRSRSARSSTPRSSRPTTSRRRRDRARAVGRSDRLRLPVPAAASRPTSTSRWTPTSRSSSRC